MVKRKADLDISKVYSHLSHRLLGDDSGYFFGKEENVNELLDLVTRTVAKGESNSLLILGPHGVGKSALVNKVLREASKQKSWSENAVIVKLNGFIAVDDKIALKDITKQLELENVVGNKVFGSFADHLTFLLTSLKSGDKDSKPIIFILEEFDTFCNHKNQSLLYNLFDIAQSRAVPICVIGVSCQIDVTELLEKRVKSRFSHRHLNMMHFKQFPEYLDFFKEFLILDKNCKIEDYQAWNKMVQRTFDTKEVQTFLESKLFMYDRSISMMKQFLYAGLVHMLSQGRQELSMDIFETSLQQVCASFSCQPLDLIIKDLSILEVCILIAVKHLSEIYDNEPFNFEMVYHEYVKFRRRRLTTLTEEKSVIFKCWENLMSLEFIVAKVGGERSRSQQLEYLLNISHLPAATLKKSVEKYPNCPTEVLQWLNSSTHN
eukprot:TRINITY_DN3284_c0_g2_i2.p1 TRINITY_DN3284_c0_g2~~TRINITY_DN3284_c0_g2_i2.p1  ORF type:complete len:433 (-),score=79.04 TRINITY_DN3284_c0_g2_i2:482-1780(-)